MKSRFLEEKNIHLAFEVSLFLKGLFAVAEIVTGIGVYFVTQQFVLKLAERITREELLEDRRDSIATPSHVTDRSLLHGRELISVQIRASGLGASIAPGTASVQMGFGSPRFVA